MARPNPSPMPTKTRPTIACAKLCDCVKRNGGDDDQDEILIVMLGSGR